MPKLFLEGSASVGADRSGSRGSENDLFVGLKLTWNLYDSGVTASRERAFTERVGQSEFQRDVRIRDVQETAERSWIGYVNGRKRNAILRRQVSKNREIVSSYIEEYELSKRTLLDVLDAERARFNSQFQQISAAAAYQFAGFRILATQSRLAAFFGIEQSSIAADPYFEEQFTADPFGIFNIDIEPLK